MESITILGKRWLGMVLGLALMAAAAGAGAQGLPDFTQLVEENAPAIVNISSTREPTEREEQERETLEDLLRYFYGDEMPELPDQRERQRQRAAMGSGFIISENGYVVTNHHVVAQGGEIVVTLNDRREFNAEVVGSDESSDLALLKIEAEDLPVVRMAEPETLKVGEWVLAIGSPFGLNYSVAAGIVSYIGRNLPSVEGVGNYVSYIQTDVAINPGHSGGPLFNLDGEVVGINSQIFTNSGGSIGLSFAIPVDVASNVLSQLKDNGSVSRGWMGVSIGDVSPDLAEAFDLETPRGALVNQVGPDSPAREAGIRSGDVIVNFDGHAITTSGDLPYHVGMTTPGSEAEVGLIRQGEPMTVEMTVGSLEESGGMLAGGDRGEPSVNRLGLAVRELDADMREELSLDHGVVVESVEGQMAREAGFRQGDVILSIAGEPIESVEAFRRVVAQLPAGRALPVLVSRRGQQSFLTVRIPESDPR